MMREFNLDEWLKSDKTIPVALKNGTPVRIICWDARGSDREDDIIALVSSKLGSENIMRFYRSGKLISDSRIEEVRGSKDLVFLEKDRLEDIVQDLLDGKYQEKDKSSVIDKINELFKKDN